MGVLAAVKPPRRIRIGPHTYKVTVNEGPRLRGEGRRGDCNPDQCRVAIDPDLPHTMAADSLLHELTHCAWSQSALRGSDALDDHEEAIVQALAPLLLALLRSNPKLVAYLTD